MCVCFEDFRGKVGARVNYTMSVKKKVVEGRIGDVMHFRSGTLRTHTCVTISKEIFEQRIAQPLAYLGRVR